ncbi:MAG: hypothetical protein V4662_13045 [Verrucomicrobiota bacterium]
MKLTRHRVFLVLWGLFILWKLWSCDWIIKCRYAYSDPEPPISVTYGTETYRPRSSPIWDPPTPAKLSARGEDMGFQGGGTWGPTEEPHLHIHWFMWLGQIFVAGSMLYLLVQGIAEARSEAAGEGMAG